MSEPRYYISHSPEWRWCVRDRTKQQQTFGGGTEDRYLASKLERGVACAFVNALNAMQDIDSPAEFVQRAKELEAAAQAVIDNPSCADPDCCPAAYAHELALHQLKALLTPPAPPTPEQKANANALASGSAMNGI